MPNSTTAPTVVGPDRNNQIKVHTDRMTILIRREYDDLRNFRAYVDAGLARDNSEALAHLDRRERRLGADRYLPRGVDAKIDRFYDQLHEAAGDAYIALTGEALALLDDLNLVQGNIARAVETARYSQEACADGNGCRCTPGVVTNVKLYQGLFGIIIEINPPSTPEQIPTEDIPTALLQEMAEYAIEEDNLDITLDDALDGHDRARVYLALAVRAYRAGFHAGRKAP